MVFRYEKALDVSKPKTSIPTLDMMQNETLRFLSETLQSRRDIQLNGFAGREMTTTEGKDGRAFRIRIFLTPTGIYHLFSGGSKAQMQKQAAQIDKVFDSFRILPQ